MKTPYERHFSQVDYQDLILQMKDLNSKNDYMLFIQIYMTWYVASLWPQKAKRAGCTGHSLRMMWLPDRI